MTTSKGGRRRQPTALKVVKGERKDRMPAGEPKPTLGVVAPPAWLVGEALEVWAEYAPDLIDKGVLDPWGVERFASYCDWEARAREARRHLDEEGTVVQVPVFDRNGRQQDGFRLARSEWFAVLSSAEDHARRLAGSFGLTPSERGNVSVTNGDGEGDSQDPARLLSGG